MTQGGAAPRTDPLVANGCPLGRTPLAPPEAMTMSDDDTPNKPGAAPKCCGVPMAELEGGIFVQESETAYRCMKCRGVMLVRRGAGRGGE